MVLSQISWIIKYFCVWLKTNIFIIVFQFYNTMRCPLPKKKIILWSLYIQELRKVLCNFLFLWPVYNAELLFCLTPITGSYQLTYHIKCSQPTASPIFMLSEMGCILLYSQPYKTNMAHKHYDSDLVKQYLHEVHDGEIAPTFVLCSSESWFHLSGCVTSQNNRYRSAKNLMLIHILPIHDVKRLKLVVYLCTTKFNIKKFCMVLTLCWGFCTSKQTVPLLYTSLTYRFL